MMVGVADVVVIGAVDVVAIGVAIGVVDVVVDVVVGVVSTDKVHLPHP